MEEKLKSGIITEVDPEKRLNIKINREVAAEFKKLAKRRGQTVSSMVRLLIIDYIKAHRDNN